MKTNPTLFNSTAPLALMHATPIERRMGRFMRAEDHSSSPAPSPSPAATEAPAPEGDAAAAAAAAEAAAKLAAADQVTSLAGGAGAGKEGAEGEAKPADEAGKEGEEASGEKPPILGAPEAYDVKAPEGMTFDKEAFDAVEPILREMDLSNDAAQKLVAAYGEKVIPMLVERGKAQAEQAQTDAGAALRKEWAEASKADPEIGGAKFDKTIDDVATVWQQFGIKPGVGIRQILDDSGLGNHPDMLRFLARVGKSMGEGSFIPPGGAGSGERKTDKDVFYGSAAT